MWQVMFWGGMAGLITAAVCAVAGIAREYLRWLDESPASAWAGIVLAILVLLACATVGGVKLSEAEAYRDDAPLYLPPPADAP